MVKKSEVRKVVDKTFDACKSAGFKKLCVRTAESYAGLNENKILEITKKHVKYRKFNVKFLNKAITRPVRVPSVMEQVQIDLTNLSSQRVEYEGKVYRYVLSVMGLFSRFHWLSPLQRKFTHHFAEQLSKIFSEHGPLDRVQSDNDGEFKKDVKKFVAVILSYFYEVVSIVIAKNGTIGNEKQRLSNET